MDIKPIETRYKGYRFRSRLEARWAVFFDAMGLNWEYEPQGFVLPSGVPYLPDFKVYIGESHVWFEVKGPDASDAEKGKCAGLAEGLGVPCFIASGTMGTPNLVGAGVSGYMVQGSVGIWCRVQ